MIFFHQMWYIKINNEGKAMAEFASNLSRHTKSVNVVRFSPDGQILSSGGDGWLISFVLFIVYCKCGIVQS